MEQPSRGNCRSEVSRNVAASLFFAADTGCRVRLFELLSISMVPAASALCSSMSSSCRRRDLSRELARMRASRLCRSGSRRTEGRARPACPFALRPVAHGCRGGGCARMGCMANRLTQTTSPYLLQHADNPVDWWPWSPEEARKRDVPVLLSVGYASCRWCQWTREPSSPRPSRLSEARGDRGWRLPEGGNTEHKRTTG
ncbi:DUF255 domain-containing protein [Streptomyces cyaneofuscatus]